MAKTPKKPVFCYFFPFFHILESNFRPILPHRVFLTYSGVVLCRLWPLYAKKWQNELLLHNFLRGLRPLGIVCRRTFLVRRRTKCSSVLFVDVRRRTSTNIDEQVPATRATHDEQRRTSTNNDEHRRTIFFFPPTTNIDEHFVRLHTRCGSQQNDNLNDNLNDMS